MDGQQRASERFFGVEEVADVRGGVVLAGVAVTLGHDRLEFFAMFQSAHVDATVRCVGSAISRHASRRDAVKGVNSLFYGGKYVVGFRDAEKMTRFVLG